MRYLVTFGEVGNYFDIIGTGSMRVVASRVAILYGCSQSFENAIWTSTFYRESIRF
jgi:hypothetical protein